MKNKLVSERVRLKSASEVSELFFDREWTDGLPIIPPTEDKVREFLDYANLEPDQVLGTITERNRKLTAEKLAINAVMAGCRPEYMPVLVAAVEAVTAPEYRFNHMASLGSPWPIIIVNGPAVKQLKINSGGYLLGGLNRANATISRALSLLLLNCGAANLTGIQAGQFGNLFRTTGCIGENEDTPWVPLHVQLGFSKEQSVATVVSTMNPPTAMLRVASVEPELILDSVTEALTSLSFYKGLYVVLMPPHFAEQFDRHGWTKDKVNDYIMSHSKRTVASLKRMSRWGTQGVDFTGFAGDPSFQKVLPGDEQKEVYLFRENPEHDRFLFGPSHNVRKMQIYNVVAGRTFGPFVVVIGTYPASTLPVSKVIRMKT